MLSFADHRVFSSVEDRFQSCMFCGKELVVLPNDRRGGACFDCLSLLGPDPVPCPGCGSEMPTSQPIGGCRRCGWKPSAE
ncbi:MAG TPA: hypothetical protein VGV64_04740 [Thermoplasmata archaeon]|nr:hypothetical protein [Thermoplasmata archaeon]